MKGKLEQIHKANTYQQANTANKANTYQEAFSVPQVLYCVF